MGQFISNVKYALNRKRLVMLGQWKSQHMPIQKMEDPIDFVVTWVDNTDSAWLTEKKKYEQQLGVAACQENNGEERYRDWDFFRYWFRAVEKYAPWVRNVYLVTYGHIPKWLNTSAPKLRVVNHEDFIPDKYLPVFSCNPIELNLYRIEGLSEHFVYFNDDMFLNKPVIPEDFFRGGKPNYAALANPIRNDSNCGFDHMRFTTIGLVNREFTNEISFIMKEHPERWFAKQYGVQIIHNLRAFDDGYLPGMAFSHLGVPFRKSMMSRAWEDIPSELDQTSRHRFRTDKDVIHQVFSLWEMLKGEFCPVALEHYGKLFSVSMGKKNEIIDAIQNEKYRMICINDNESVSHEDYLMLKEEICKAFEQVLPQKSSFEK